MKHFKIAIVSFAAIMLAATGCKKSYLQTSPSDAVTSTALFVNTTTAYQLIDGIARVMNTTQAGYTTQDAAAARANDFGESAVRLENDCMGQDLVRGGAAVASYDWFYYCSTYIGIRQPTYNVAQLSWRLYFNIINAANLLLDSVDYLPVIVPSDQNAKDNLKGQAFAFRAYSYYKASIFYCKTYMSSNLTTAVPQTSQLGLPIYTTGTQASTKGKARATLGDTYKQIVADLDSAKFYMERAGAAPSGRPMSDITTPVMYGITAEVALVMHDWAKARDMADLAITSSGKTLMTRTQYTQGFNSKSNPEWMWASNLTATQRASMYGQNFYSFVDPSNSAGYAAIGITSQIAQATLDVMKNLGDVRSTTFTGSNQQTKFHLANPSTWDFDLLYMRLSEMYLIKAEAQAELGQEADGIATLTTLVLARNSGYDYTSNLKRYTQANSVGQSDAAYFGRTSLLKEIYLQRRIELFLEGFAYADIQREHCGLNRPSGSTNFSLTNSGVLKIAAESNSFLFKVPQQELDSNPAMAGQQNP